MRKPLYWAAAAMICGATMVGFASCNDDDDDNNSNSNSDNGSSTTVTKPVKGTDFNVNVDGNIVTVSTSLTASVMYVLFDGAQYTLSDGKVEINIPLSGDYSMTFNVYDNGSVSSSDEFSVTIAATDLSFLDNSVTLTALTGGKAVYEAATADANGYKFSRTMRIDWFFNNSGISYSKSGYGSGIFYYGYQNEAKTLAVSAGRGSYQGQKGVEDASIAFDFVKQVAKLTVVDGFHTASGELVPAGDYYAPFTYKLNSTNLFDGVNTCDWSAVDQGTSFASDQVSSFGTMADEYVSITLDNIAIGGDGIVRLPVDDVYSYKALDDGGNEYNDIATADRLNFEIFTNSDKNVAFAHMHRTLDGGKDGSFELVYTYVFDECQYTYTVPEEEEAGVWESCIKFWGNGDGNSISDDNAECNTVKLANGDNVYTLKMKAAATAECFVIHFASVKSYETLTADGITLEVKSVKINGEEAAETSPLAASAATVVNGDNNGNFRFQWFNTWAGTGSSFAMAAGDEIEITVSCSGL